MTPERWLKVKNVLETVLERPAAERGAYLEEACGADAELFGEVESLLAFKDSIVKDVFEDNLPPFNFIENAERSGGFVGKQIGKYRVVRELGAGGMGVVFLAERTGGDFEQTVAIKFLRHFSSESALRRFMLERKILARLRHRFIAQLIDGGTTDEGTPYLVMEYVAGSPITSYAAARKLTLDERLALFYKVCSAVSFAHRNLIVHRDLKPDNILITDEGVPKLLDFGIAKLLAETEVKVTVTQQQAFTPEYASPEQIKGEAITTASDVYVLGVILYELLSGNRPFQFADADRRKEIWHVVNRSEPPKPSETAKQSETQNPKSKIEKRNSPFNVQNLKSFKGDLDNIVLKALKREPERRYKTVEQLTEDLRRYQQGLTVKARPDTFFYRADKFVRRHRWAIVAACLVVSSLLVGLLTTMRQSRRAERERLRAEQRAEDLRNISKSLIFNVHEAIRNLPGSLPARKILLEKAVEQLQLLAREAEDNAELQDDLAQAYFNVGEMQQAVGNIAEAEAAHRRALTIYERLTAENSQNSSYRRGLARGYGFLANIDYLRGESGKSAELYAQVPPILEQLAAENPNDPKNLVDLWNAYANRAISLNKLGKFEDALPVCEKSLEIAVQIYGNESSSPENRQILYQSKGLIAAAKIASGDDPKAIAQLEEVIRDARKLSGEFPEDTRFKYDLWAFYRRIGIAYSERGDFPAAVSSLEKSFSLIEHLLKSSPKDVGYKRNASVTLLALGQTFLNYREPKKALAFLIKSCEISEALLVNDGINGETIADLALIYSALGAAQKKTNALEIGLLNQEKSLDFFNRSLAKSPENIETMRNFVGALKKTAETYIHLAKRQKSEKTAAYREKANLLFERSREIAQR